MAVIFTSPLKRGKKNAFFVVLFCGLNSHYENSSRLKRRLAKKNGASLKTKSSFLAQNDHLKPNIVAMMSFCEETRTVIPLLLLVF